MPLASWFAHHWYPGMASVVDTSSPTTSLTMKGVARMSLANTASASESLGLVATKTMSLLNTTSPLAVLNMKGVARMSMLNKIGELTADDVTGAVLEAQIVPGLTLKQAILDARSRAGLAAALSA